MRPYTEGNFLSCCRLCEQSRGVHHTARCESRATAASVSLVGCGVPVQVDVFWVASGERVRFVASATQATVYNLKCAIHAAIGISPIRQELVKDTRKLKDVEILESCGILPSSPCVGLVSVQRPRVILLGSSVVDPRHRDPFLFLPAGSGDINSLMDSGCLAKLATAHSVLMFDCTAEIWQPLPTMSCRREKPQIATLKGKIYVVGGCYESAYLYGSVDELEALDIETSTWEIIPNGHRYERNATLVATEENICVFDSSWSGQWSPDGRSWTALSPLRLPTENHFKVAALRRKLYAIGFRALALEPATSRSWNKLRGMRMPRQRPFVSGIRDKIYVLGGATLDDDGCLLEVFDPTTSTWSTLAPPPGGMAANAAVAVHNDHIYVFGGYSTPKDYEEAIANGDVGELPDLTETPGSSSVKRVELPEFIPE